MTGYAMANHGQHLEFSTNIHKLFGWSLMAAGFCRVVEICFVLRDAPTPDLSDEEAEHAGDGPQRPKAFQHLTPFLLVLSGLTFLSATEEQMQWVAGSGMDSTTYGNVRSPLSVRVRARASSLSSRKLTPRPAGSTRSSSPARSPSTSSSP